MRWFVRGMVGEEREKWDSVRWGREDEWGLNYSMSNGYREEEKPEKRLRKPGERGEGKKQPGLKQSPKGHCLIWVTGRSLKWTTSRGWETRGVGCHRNQGGAEKGIFKCFRSTFPLSSGCCGWQRRTNILRPTKEHCCQLNCDRSLIVKYVLISEIKHAKQPKYILDSKSCNVLRTEKYLLGCYQEVIDYCE